MCFHTVKDISIPLSNRKETNHELLTRLHNSFSKQWGYDKYKHPQKNRSGVSVIQYMERYQNSSQDPRDLFLSIGFQVNDLNNGKVQQNACRSICLHQRMFS